MCNDLTVRFTTKQRLVLSVLSAFFVIVAATIFFWPRSKNKGYDAQTVAIFESVRPGLCRMQSKIELSQLAGASNVFWAEVHAGTHLLAAKTDELDSALGNKFRVAKGVVESDLSTLDKARLATDVATFMAVVSEALVLVNIDNANTSCEELTQ